MFVLAGASLFGALGLDWAFGDPPNKFHPVAWIGALVGRLVPRLKAKHRERLRGALFAVLVVGLVSTGTYFVLEGVYIYAGGIAFVVSSALVLKVAIAVRGMERHAGAIMEALKNGDLAGARNNLSMIVRRDTRRRPHTFRNNRVHRGKHRGRDLRANLLLYPVWRGRRSGIQDNQYARFDGRLQGRVLFKNRLVVCVA
jgi:hypothetical protein